MSDLRDQIDAAIRQPLLIGLDDPCGPERAGEWADHLVRWVLEVVQPALDAKDDEIEKLRGHYPATEKAVRAVQQWMALDLHRALGRTDDPTSEHQGSRSWGDWWAELLHAVRQLQAERDRYQAAWWSARIGRAKLRQEIKLLRRAVARAEGSENYMSKHWHRMFQRAWDLNKEAAKQRKRAETADAELARLREYGKQLGNQRPEYHLYRTDASDWAIADGGGWVPGTFPSLLDALNAALDQPTDEGSCAAADQPEET